MIIPLDNEGCWSISMYRHNAILHRFNHNVEMELYDDLNKMSECEKVEVCNKLIQAGENYRDFPDVSKRPINFCI